MSQETCPSLQKSHELAVFKGLTPARVLATVLPTLHEPKKKAQERQLLSLQAPRN